MMRMKTPMMLPMLMKYMRMAALRVLSMTSTSRLKRLVMRPSGVVAKKDMGARSTRLMACRSIVLDAVVPKMDSDTMKENMRSACAAPSPAYTPMYVPVARLNLSPVQNDSHSDVAMLDPCERIKSITTRGPLRLVPDARMLLS